jgi:hypothetical protein
MRHQCTLLIQVLLRIPSCKIVCENYVTLRRFISLRLRFEDIAANPSKEASLERTSSGEDQFSRDIIETPLYRVEVYATKVNLSLTSLAMLL